MCEVLKWCGGLTGKEWIWIERHGPFKYGARCFKSIYECWEGGWGKRKGIFWGVFELATHSHDQLAFLFFFSPLVFFTLFSLFLPSCFFYFFFSLLPLSYSLKKVKTNAKKKRIWEIVEGHFWDIWTLKRSEGNIITMAKGKEKKIKGYKTKGKTKRREKQKRGHKQSKKKQKNKKTKTKRRKQKGKALMENYKKQIKK